jgi:hypothetical protein
MGKSSKPAEVKPLAKPPKQADLLQAEDVVLGDEDVLNDSQSLGKRALSRPLGGGGLFSGLGGA